MRLLKLAPIAVLGVVAIGCDDTSSPNNVKIAVAPLTLPNMNDACYALEVQNDVGDTVWSREHVCASQYGNNIGDITYIGTCDAQDNDGSNGARNTVTLTLENIYTATVDPGNYALGAVPDAEWDNPCGRFSDGTFVDGDPATVGNQNGDSYGPCQLTFNCEENADVLVEFNITVMRDAQQGFFDIAVNFEDVFCSAKVDCENTEGETNSLLFGKDGERHDTLVMAFACTAGPNANTTLYMDNVTVTCEGDNGVGPVVVPRTYIRPFDGPGNVQYGSVSPGGSLEPLNPGGFPVQVWWLPLAGPPDATDTGPEDYRSHRPVFQQGVYEGVEQLGDFRKLYWNTALAFNLAGFSYSGPDGAGLADPGVCTLHTTLGVSDGALAQGGVAGVTPTNATTPAITVNVPLNPGGGTDLTCGVHPLNGEGSGVQTTYSPIGNPWCFEYEMSADFDALTVDSHNLNSINPQTGRFDTFPMRCTKVGGMIGRVYFDADDDGDFGAGDLPISGAWIGGSPPGNPVLTDANGLATHIAYATTSNLGNNPTVAFQGFFTGPPAGAQDCGRSGGNFVGPEVGYYTVYNPQGGTDTIYDFRFHCEMP